MDIRLKEANSEENHRLQEAITDYNVQIIKDLPRAKSQKIDLIAWTSTNEWIGGVNAEWVNWGILFIHLLFIEDRFREKGYGSLLLKEVENRAKSHGCYLAHLDTFDFQGKDFYLKNGYTIFGVLDDCPKGHQRYYFKKILTI
jgi:GNAT superfamily N-acetyltransferase